ncbi:FxsA family protein [Evansella cellulosilytica]|uniref:FxsA cytoplasmic membrane protein n=1 Tax=Evansella cellulosilytica (strain ATCC 21833 / DSM 2522 / FERM P-1141 / JCM 9156 / N-4) TaxID=649639 RepID=E6U0M0_EVAC2|nr:FxsA family protein [Evansella cellulosilytica]ADU31465.1 FxsA cytoplasmic membrane protein [Evansella cellulosilytica DSM 2522]
MGRLFFLLIIIVPALEIWVLILSGNMIGVIPTILLIILTGVLGAALAKREGLNAIRTAQMQASQGMVPSSVLLDGICILVGAVVLLTPGFITDAIGFFLLLPLTRGVFKGFLQKMFQRMIRSGNIVFHSNKRW